MPISFNEQDKNIVCVQPEPPAKTIFQDDPRWQVRSAGTEEGARIKVTAGMLGWADVVVVMEKRHKERLRQKHPEALVEKPCVCLFIPDDYEYMEEELIRVLREKMREKFKIQTPNFRE